MSRYARKWIRRQGRVAHLVLNDLERGTHLADQRHHLG